MADVDDIGNAAGISYVSMEYGHDLAEELQRGPLRPARAAEVALAVAAALDAAHNLDVVIDGKPHYGIVHGDI